MYWWESVNEKEWGTYLIDGKPTSDLAERNCNNCAKNALKIALEVSENLLYNEKRGSNLEWLVLWLW